MESRAYRLRFHGSLHVGEQSIGLETSLPYVPSDTLFSALVVTLSRSSGHRQVVADLHQAFSNRSPLILSSAFPYAGEYMLLPKPHLPLFPTSGEDGSGKAFKRVAWVSASIFTRLISGIKQDELDQLWQAGVRAQGDQVWLTAHEAETINAARNRTARAELRFWDLAREPKVAVGRINQASALFHVGRLHFAHDCGLWCMARGDADWLGYLDDGLRLMQHEGLGGKRSQGSGQFAVEEAVPMPDLAPFNPDSASMAVLLSRLSPRREQLDLLTHAGAGYHLVTVGGYIGATGASSLIRKQVRLVAEGSVIGQSAAPPGQLVNVTPNHAPQLSHPVYRYGVGFTVPAHLPQEAAQ